MSDSKRLRAVVIGLGRMGMHHVRVCGYASDIDLVAILDHKPDWAVTVGAETQSLVAADVESLYGKVDMAIIAVPTEDHATTAIPLLREGISCLVEKPIALSEDDAQAMIAAAEASGVQLQIGHVERFNPAVSHMVPLLRDAGRITGVAARRHNLLSDRTYDIDAVLDLMIHDIDLLSVLSLNSVKSISVEDGATHHNVAVTMTSGSETHLHLSVNRDAPRQVRELVIETEVCTYTIDYLTQRLSRTTQSQSEELPVEPGDPLQRQLKAFAAAVRSGDNIGAMGVHGLTALRLANRVRAAAGLT